jgi:PAS domain S-box-containing protein
VAVLNGVRLVDAGHVVTSAGISAGTDLALHVVERLHGESAAAWTARGMEHLWSQQYRSIFDSSADAILIVDQGGRIAEANKTACQLFCYDRHELVGMQAVALAPSELHDEFAAHFKSPPAELRSVGQRKDGTRFHAELRSTSFEYRGLPHALSMIRDITARVEAEEAVHRERQRLSRDLHDSVSQALYGIVLGAETARAMAERDPAQAIQPLDYILSLARTGMAEMRALIFELRPEALEQEGLIAALSRRAAALEAEHQVRVRLALCDEPVAPPAVKEALYRIVQEAMQNTVKHARATEIQLSLECRDATLVLEIRDNGKGFDTTGSFPGHLGLQSMRERATQLGGSLRMESAVGAGTTITVRVPVGSDLGAVAAMPR